MCLVLHQQCTVLIWDIFIIMKSNNTFLLTYLDDILSLSILLSHRCHLCVDLSMLTKSIAHQVFLPVQANHSLLEHSCSSSHCESTSNYVPTPSCSSMRVHPHMQQKGPLMFWNKQWPTKKRLMHLPSKVSKFLSQDIS